MSDEEVKNSHRGHRFGQTNVFLPGTVKPYRFGPIDSELKKKEVALHFEQTQKPLEELVPLNIRHINGKDQLTANMRDIHKAARQGRDFSSWAKGRLELFTEGVDFIKEHVTKGGELFHGKTDYIVILRAAQHVALQENNEWGRKVRDYFIDAEERSHQQMRVYNRKDPNVILDVIDGLIEEVEKCKAKIKEDAPKVDTFDRVLAASGSHCITDVGKMLGFGRERFFRMLECDGFIFKRPGGSVWLAIQKHLDAGLFVFIEGEANGRVTEQTRITSKGVDHFRRIYRPKETPPKNIQLH